MLWLYLHFPRLQLDQFESIHERHNDAIVVIHPDTNTVMQLSAKAQEAGIKPGMGLAEVSAIHAQTNILEYSLKTEQSQLQHLACILYEIASDIVVYSPSGLALNLTPLIRYYLGLENVFSLCKHTLGQCQVSYQFGSGATIEMAQVLALSASNTLFDNPQSAVAALANCTLSATQLTPKEQQQLTRTGFCSLGQVLAVPPEELGKRFANHMLLYLLSLKGIKQPPYAKFHPKAEFSQYIELPYAAESTTSIQRYLSEVLHNCCAFLRTRNMASDHLALSLYQREHDALNVTITAGAAHHSHQEWHTLIALKLEQIELLSPVVGLRLHCDTLYEFKAENLSLLPGTVSRHSENLLLGKLLARLGTENVCEPAAVNDHRFECFTQAVKPSSPRTMQNSAATGLQPSLLVNPPRPLTQETHIVFGPLRIHTGWWDTLPVKRDYFIAQSAAGERLWVFRDDQQNWFLHGYFS